MEPVQLTILYEDNHLLAVSKPAGLLVQGDRTGDPTVLDQAKSYLKQKYHKPGKVYLGLVHRLDRPVSGLLLLARTSKAASRLSEQFRAGQVVKTYLAVVTGRPSPAKGELTAFLSARGDPNGRTQARKQPFSGAKEAHLTYNVQNCAADRALLEIQPRTGRRHQIRAQLALVGHPVVGDVKYGAEQALPDRSIGLHALRLVVAHPIGGEELVLTAPLPAAWPWPPPSGK
jgi:23S rRNA pseudouridine1911/1915/1917 synthase